MLAFRPSLCSIEWTIPPSRPPFLGARRWMAVKDGRKATAKRRLASLRATRRRADAGDRRALGHTSASHDPYRHREAELGSPSKSGTAIPSIIVLLLTGRSNRALERSSRLAFYPSEPMGAHL